MGLLSVAIWLPVAVGVLLLAAGRDEHSNAVRWAALLGAVLSTTLATELARAGAGGAPEAMQQAYATSISHLFLWATGLSLVALLAALRVRDPASMRVPAASPPAEM